MELVSQSQIYRCKANNTLLNHRSLCLYLDNYSAHRKTFQMKIVGLKEITVFERIYEGRYTPSFMVLSGFIRRIWTKIKFA